MKNKIILACLLSYSCMYYSFKGSIPAHINSIYLMPIMNQSSEFIISEILDEELGQLIIEGNLLDIARPENADSQLEILITSVVEKPYSIGLSDASGMEEVEQWKLTISSQVIWYDAKLDETLLKKNMTSWSVYAPGLDISMDLLDNDSDGFIDGEDSDEVGSARESALNISIKRLALDIVNEINNTW